MPLRDGSLGFRGDRKLQTQYLARNKVLGEFALHQRLFGLVLSLSITPTAAGSLEVHDQQRLIGLDDQVDPGEQVGQTGNDDPPQLFFDAENLFLRLGAAAIRPQDGATHGLETSGPLVVLGRFHMTVPGDRQLCPTH